MPQDKDMASQSLGAPSAQGLKPGTRVEMPVAVPGHAPIHGTICRVRKAHLPFPGNGEGWHIVMFDDGTAPLCVHESRFRVIDNGAVR